MKMREETGGRRPLPLGFAGYKAIGDCSTLHFNLQCTRSDTRQHEGSGECGGDTVAASGRLLLDVGWVQDVGVDAGEPRGPHRGSWLNHNNHESRLCTLAEFS